MKTVEVGWFFLYLFFFKLLDLVSPPRKTLKMNKPEMLPMVKF